MINRILPIIVCGFAAAVVSIIPLVKDVTFCLAVPFAAFFSLFLKLKIERSNEEIKAGTAVGFGIGTGLFASFFYTLFVAIMIFVTKTHELFQNLPEIEGMMKEMSGSLGIVEDQFEMMINLIRDMESNIKTKGFSVLFLSLIFFSSAFFNFIFGLIGGLIGMVILNRKMK